MRYVTRSRIFTDRIAGGLDGHLITKLLTLLTSVWTTWNSDYTSVPAESQWLLLFEPILDRTLMVPNPIAVILDNGLLVGISWTVNKLFV